MICPNINDPDWIALKNTVGETRAKEVWSNLSGTDKASQKIKDYISGKLKASDVNKPTQLTHVQLKNFLLDSNEIEISESNKQKLVDKIKAQIEGYSLDSPKRTYFDSSTNKNIDFRGVTGALLDNKVNEIVNAMIERKAQIRPLTRWLLSGADFTKLSDFFGNSSTMNKDVLSEFVAAINYDPGFDKIMSLKEYMKFKGIPDSDFFNEDTIVVIHKNDGINENAISVYEITNDITIPNRHDSLDLFYNFYKDSNLSTKKRIHNRLDIPKTPEGYKQFVNGVLMGYLKNNVKSLSIRNSGLVTIKQGSVFSSTLDLNKTLRYLQYMKKFTDVAEKMPYEIQGVVENEKLHNLNAYGIDPLKIILEYFDKVERRNVRTTKSSQILKSKITKYDNVRDINKIIKALTEFINYNTSKFEIDMNDPLMKYASEALKFYSSPKIINHNDEHRNFEAVWNNIISVTKIGDETFQWMHSQIMRAAKIIERELKAFVLKHNQIVSKVIDDYYKSNSAIRSDFNIRDHSNKIFEKMYKTTTAYYIDKNGNEQSVEVKIPSIHWDKSDPETKKLLDNGTLKDAHIEYGKFVVETINNQLKELIKHDLLNHSTDYYNFNGTIKEDMLNADAELRFNAVMPKENWGRVPYFKRSIFQTLTESFGMETVSNVVKATQKGFSDAVNPNKIIEQSYENETFNDKLNIVSDSFSYQFFPTENNVMTKYGPEKMLKSMGYRYENDRLIIEDFDSRNFSDFSTDIKIITDYYVRNSLRKRIYEKEALPYINAALHLMKIRNVKNDGRFKEIVEHAELFVSRFIHGQTQRILGPVNVLGLKDVSGDQVAAGLIKVMSLSAMTLNVKIAITAMTTNILKTIPIIMTNYTGFLDRASITKSLGIVFSSFKGISSGKFSEDSKKYMLMIDKYGILESTDDDIMRLPKYQIQKQTAFQSYWFHWLSYKPDFIVRAIVTMAQMIYDGTWDAHYVVNENGVDVLKYDVTKDKKYYTAGKQSEEQKALLENLKQTLEIEGVISEGQPLDRSVTDKEVRRYKEVIDTYVLGSYTKDNTVKYASTAFSSAFMQFRRYLTDTVNNKMGRYREVENLGKYVTVKGENGNTEVFWQKKQFEGELLSLGFAIRELYDVRKELLSGGGKEAWDKLPEFRKKNIVKLMNEIALFLASYIVFEMIVKTSDDDDEEGFIELNSLLKPIRNAILDIINIFSIFYWKELIENPIPALGLLDTLDQVLFKGNINKAVTMIPGVKSYQVVSEVVSDEE